MKPSQIIAIFAVILALVVFGLGETVENTVILRTAAILILTIALLSTAALPEYLTILLFFFLSVVIAVAPPNIVFSGFLSGAAWLVFGGMILGVAIEATGLGTRIAGYIERAFAQSYFRVLFGTVIIMCLFSFIMPSSVGRVTIMLPIVLALAKQLGFKDGGNGQAGLILAVALGTLVPTFAILPASVPNVAMAGAAEAIYGIRFTYTEYLVLHFPVIGIVTTLAMPVFIAVLFPDRISAKSRPPESKPLSQAERRLLLILICALAFWTTDSLHGVSPAWVALGAGIACVMPGVGIMPKGPIMSNMNFGPLFVVAGFIGMGAVVTHSGLGETVAGSLIGNIGLEKGTGFGTFASVIGLGSVLGLATTLPGQPAIMTSFAQTLSQATGWPLAAVLMAQVPSWALLMFPYQAPPLVATKVITGLPVVKFLRLMLPMALFGWIVMVPMQYFWWKFLGYLG